MKLANKVAIITGSGSGMGRASALLFSQEGAKIVVADMNEENGKKTVADIKAQGGEAVFAYADVTSPECCQAIAKAAMAAFGRIDIVMNCAGIAQTAKMVWDLEPKEFDKVFNINVKSAWLMAMYTGQEVKKNGGSFIMIGSTGALKPRATQGLYGAAKAALNTLAIGLAAEFAPEARVNVINPGPTATPMLATFVQTYNDDVANEIAQGTMLKKLIHPEDIANAALFLASDDSACVTGTSLLVDAGAINARPKN